MDNNLFAGLTSGLVAVVLLITLAVKTELIKSFVAKITGTKYSLFYTFIGILGVTALTFFLSKHAAPSDSEPVQTVSVKTEPEVWQDVGEETSEYIIDKFNGAQENRAEKDSIYQANREIKWVYQIGNVVNAPDLLFETYRLIYNPRGVSVFKVDKTTFFLFQEDSGDEMMMRNSLEVFENTFGDGIDCKVVDLIANCGRKEKFIKTKDLKIRGDGDKVFLPCYECGK